MRRKKKFGGYTVAGVPQKDERNWGAQIVMAILLGVIFCGPFIARAFRWHMSLAALAVSLALDVLLLLAVFLWAFRTWNY